MIENDVIIAEQRVNFVCRFTLFSVSPVASTCEILVLFQFSKDPCPSRLICLKGLLGCGYALLRIEKGAVDWSGLDL